MNNHGHAPDDSRLAMVLAARAQVLAAHAAGWKVLHDLDGREQATGWIEQDVSQIYEILLQLERLETGAGA